MRECTKCKEHKDVSLFYKAARRPSGYHDQCKECCNEASTNSRSKKKPHYRAVRKARRDSNVALMRVWKAERGCACCSENEPSCLDLHHPDPSVKDMDPADHIKCSFASFLKEAEKCVVVCANCHRKIHAGVLTL